MNDVYVRYSIAFDPENEEDKEVLDWMKENHSRANKYSEMIRKAMREYVKKQKRLEEFRKGEK